MHGLADSDRDAGFARSVVMLASPPGCRRERVAAMGRHSVVGCVVAVFVLRCLSRMCVLGGYGVCSLCAIMQLTEISRCLGSVTRNDVADMPTSGKLMPAHPWMGHTAPSMHAIH